MQSSKVLKQAYQSPLDADKVRILLKLQNIECIFENNAPEFIDVSRDEVTIEITPTSQIKGKIDGLQASYPLTLRDTKINSDKAIFELNQTFIFFDIDIDYVKDIWVSNIDFHLNSKFERYLFYYITSLDHQLEWLQTDIKTGEIKSLSISSKSYKVPIIAPHMRYSASEVIRCADMIGRSTQKIDLRTGGAYVKLNTNKGRLEPLIVSMAEKLGYVIKALDTETIQKMDANGKNVSHSIYLKRN